MAFGPPLPTVNYSLARYLSHGFYVLAWYIPNICTLLLNKHLYANVGFNFPFSLTAIHMAFCFVGSFFCLRVFKLFQFTPIESSETILRRVLPNAVLVTVNIVFGNVALQYIPISFHQVIKSLGPALALLSQVTCFPNATSTPISLFLSIIPVVGGVMLAVATELSFDMRGFSAALVAALVTAFQANFSAKIMGNNKLDSLHLLYYQSPFSVLLLLPFFYGSEGTIFLEWYSSCPPNSLWWLALSGSFAFLLNIFGLLLIQKTSALTYTVSGNLKVILSVCISVAIFHNPISIWNAFGGAIAIGGVCWYNWVRYQLSLNPPSMLESGDWKKAEED